MTDRPSSSDDPHSADDSTAPLPSPGQLDGQDAWVLDVLRRQGTPAIPADVNDRIEDALALEATIRRAGVGTLPPTDIGAGPSATTARLADHRRRRRSAWIAIGVAASVAVVAAGLAVGHQFVGKPAITAEGTVSVPWSTSDRHYVGTGDQLAAQLEPTAAAWQRLDQERGRTPSGPPVTDDGRAVVPNAVDWEQAPSTPGPAPSPTTTITPHELPDLSWCLRYFSHQTASVPAFVEFAEYQHSASERPAPAAFIALRPANSRHLEFLVVSPTCSPGDTHVHARATVTVASPPGQ